MTQFTNQAQLIYNNSTKNSNVAYGEVQEVLNVYKIPVTPNYCYESKVCYAVSLVNCGDFVMTGLQVVDNMGGYTENGANCVPLDYVDQSVRFYQNGVLQTTPMAKVQANKSLEITGLSVSANSTALLLYDATVNSYAPLAVGEQIDNEVIVSGTSLAAPLTATAILPVDPSPNLSITKSISPVPVAENGVLTYTFAIQNTGITEAGADAGVIVKDTFRPLLTDLEVTFGTSTAPLTTDQYDYDETTGEFATVAGNLIIPPANITQDPTTGEWIVTPTTMILTVSGIV